MLWIQNCRYVIISICLIREYFPSFYSSYEYYRLYSIKYSRADQTLKQITIDMFPHVSEFTIRLGLKPGGLLRSALANHYIALLHYWTAMGSNLLCVHQETRFSYWSWIVGAGVTSQETYVEQCKRLQTYITLPIICRLIYNASNIFYLL